MTAVKVKANLMIEKGSNLTQRVLLHPALAQEADLLSVAQVLDPLQLQSKN